MIDPRFGSCTPRARVARLVLTVSFAIAFASCSTAPHSGGLSPGGGGALAVVAAENFWGSIAQQVGGDLVHVTNIIDNPNADPHDYEPTTSDARAVADASLVLVNGIGYDSWAQKLVDASPSSTRVVLDVGDLAGVRPGGNPHQWYSPSVVHSVVDAIAAAYERLDPANHSRFAQQHDDLMRVGFRTYDDLIAHLKATYAGTPVGASESIFAEIAPSLGLRLLTPPAFLKAISEGTEPAAADKSTIDEQIATHAIDVYVYNSQNATPDVQRQIDECRAKGIPLTTITETLVPATATFQDWQARQLRDLARALAIATGR